MPVMSDAPLLAAGHMIRLTKYLWVHRDAEEGAPVHPRRVLHLPFFNHDHPS
jgi:hypothetical protein